MSGKTILTYIEALKILSPREIKVLELVGKGLTGDEISQELYLSVKTVYKHKSNIRSKLNLCGKGKLSIIKWYISSTNEDTLNKLE